MAGITFGNGKDCPRCFCENSLQAKANVGGSIGVVITCSHCKKEWTGGWSSVERTRTAMSRPGYIENELSGELQKLIKIASADALDTVLAGIELAIDSRVEERRTSGNPRDRDLGIQIKTLKDMQAWITTLRGSYNT